MRCPVNVRVAVITPCAQAAGVQRGCRSRLGGFFIRTTSVLQRAEEEGLQQQSPVHRDDVTLRQSILCRGFALAKFVSFSTT